MRRGRGLLGLEMDEATTAGAMGRVPTPAYALSLRGAVSVLLDAGLEPYAATTAAAFRTSIWTRH